LSIPDEQARRRIWLALIPCAALSIVLGLMSEGGYHDDDLTHFLMARWVRWFPEYLLHIWGRPGLTIPLAAVSWIGERETGWHAARMLSGLASAAAAYVAARLAMRLGLTRPCLVVIACYAQPLHNLLACTTLTENWAALYLISAVYLLVRGRALSASIVFSLALVTRHETVLLLPLWWIAVVRTAWANRSLTAASAPGAATVRLGPPVAALISASLWAPMVHNILFQLVFEEWPVRVFLEPRGSSQYPPAGWLAYVPNALHAVPPVIAGLALVGGAVLARKEWLIVAIPALYFAEQVAFKALGLFASGGYARFMVAVAPFIALLAVAGLEGMTTDRRRRAAVLTIGLVFLVGWLALEVEHAGRRIAWSDERLTWAIRAAGVVFASACLFVAGSSLRRRRAALYLALALGASVLAQWVIVLRSIGLSPSALAAREVVQWLAAENLDDAPFFATDPWFAYWLDLAENPRAHKGPALLASMPVGTVVVLDSAYSQSDFHGLEWRRVTNDRAYRTLREFGPSRPGVAHFVVLRKEAETPIPPAEDDSYPADLTARRKPLRGVYYVRQRGG